MPSSLVEVWYAQAGKTIRPGRADRPLNALVLRVTEPTRQNTGLVGKGVADYQLANYAGDITNPGGSMTRLAVTGRLLSTSTGNKLTESKILGEPTGTYATSSDSGTGLVQSTSTGSTGLVVEDCDLVPTVPSRKLNGFLGGEATLRRVYIDGVSDGAGLTRSNFRMEGSCVDRLVYFADTPDHTDGTHNDALQIFAGSGHRIIGSALWGYKAVDGRGDGGTANDYYPGSTRTTSAIMFNPAAAGLDDLQVDACWLRGGAVTVNMRDVDSMTNIAIFNTRFGGDSTFDVDISAYASTYDALTTYGNTRLSDAASAKMQRTT